MPESVPKRFKRLSRDILKGAGSSAQTTPAKSVLWSRNSLVPVIAVWVAVVTVRVVVVAVPVISIRVSAVIVAIRSVMAETQVDAEAAAVAPVMPADALAVMPAAVPAVMPAAVLAVLPAAVLAVLPAALVALTPAMATAAMARPCNRLVAEAETEQRYCERGRQEHIS